MPYNTTAIPPRKEITGQAQLPLARVKKIIGLDSDIAMCSNNASFVITLATEMFIQYLAEQGHNVVKSERKPRKNIQYKDLASAVARLDNLEFLSDIVPRTVTYKQVKERKARGEVSANGEVEAGQTTLDGRKATTNGTNGLRMDGASDLPADDDAGPSDPNAQLEIESRRAQPSNGLGPETNGKEDSEDVEMS